MRLVRDGDKYRIKAGNSRVMAMKMLGTTECWAVVDSDDTVQSVLETVVRTNTKKTYEPVEESYFVQQLAMFGSDEYVADTAGITVEQAGKVRRGREILGTLAEQMSLERMYAAVEFDGDPEAVEAGESSWRGTVDSLRRDRKQREAKEALPSRAGELGISLIDERPEDLRYACDCTDPESMSEAYMKASSRYTGIVGRITGTWNGACIDFYGVPMEDDEGEEASERRKLADEYTRVAEGVAESLAAWVKDQFLYAADGKVPPTLNAVLSAAWGKLDEVFWMKRVFKEFPEAKSDDGLLSFAIGYAEGMSGDMAPLTRRADELADDELTEFSAGRIAVSLRWVDAHIADGWEPIEAQAALLALARQKAEAASGEDADES